MSEPSRTPDLSASVPLTLEEIGALSLCVGIAKGACMRALDNNPHLDSRQRWQAMMVIVDQVQTIVHEKFAVADDFLQNAVQEESTRDD